jgi:preprotein translocase subunit SecB
MKAITSNLELLNFVVIESSLSLIQPHTDEFNHEVFKKYDIEIDFSKSKEASAKNEEILFVVYIDGSINHCDDPQVGYQIQTRAAAAFKITDIGSLSKDEINNLENISALSITISSLRNYLSTLTSFGPFGKYTLPAIKVGDLIKEKVKKQNDQKL